MAKQCNHPPMVTEAEWTVLNALWHERPRTATEVVEALNQSNWKPKTIHTLLNRLVSKGALDLDKSVRPYQYSPRFSREEFAMAESKSFLSRVFEGQLAPFLTCFLKKEKLSREEIRELKKILEEK